MSHCLTLWKFEMVDYIFMNNLYRKVIVSNQIIMVHKVGHSKEARSIITRGCHFWDDVGFLPTQPS